MTDDAAGLDEKSFGTSLVLASANAGDETVDDTLFSDRFLSDIWFGSALTAASGASCLANVE